jgi:hypothetical protein
MTIAIKKWLGLAMFGLVACGGKDVNLGEGPGDTRSAITYTGGCTPGSCANQSAAQVSGGGNAGPACAVPVSLQCVPDPFAGQGSDPAGHCNLVSVCASADAGSTPITYTGGCTPGSCANQSAAQVGGSTSGSCAPVSLQCAPDPFAGQGSDPAGHCNLVPVCASPDAG